MKLLIPADEKRHISSRERPCYKKKNSLAFFKGWMGAIGLMVAGGAMGWFAGVF